MSSYSADVVNKGKQPVAWVSQDVLDMRKNWEITRGLMGGTASMREARQKFLPQWSRETTLGYNNRLLTSTLFPAYGRTVTTLVGKPFSRAITLSEDMPDTIKLIAADIDLEGRNIDTFAAELTSDTLAHGICGVLVDYNARTGVANTQKDEAEAGLRPYWIKLHFWDILGWRYETIKGEKQIVQLRFYEYVDIPSADGYGTVRQRRIRVLMPLKYEIWTEDVNRPDTWVKTEDGVNTSPIVRFVPFYGEYCSFMKGKPPLMELAHLNIKHWQSQSDQDNIVHVIRCPLLTFQSDEVDYELAISPNMGVRLPIGAEMKFVEHTGKAVEAGKTSLDDLKDEMRQAGAELLVMRMTQATATEISADNSVGTCALQRIVNGIQDGINLALQFTADWLNESKPGTVTIFNEYGLDSLDAAVATLLFDISQGPQPIISTERVYTEYQRRGVLSADIAYIDEKALLDVQIPYKELTTPIVAPNTSADPNKPAPTKSGAKK